MDVRQPVTVDDALAIRSEDPQLLPIAGGTDVMVAANFGRIQPRGFLDLTRIPALAGHTLIDGVHRLGSGTTYTDSLRRIEGQPALSQAIRTIGSPQIRNRGTVGGNLGTASPAGDTLPVLSCYEATVQVAAAERGYRQIPIDAFVLGPKRTSLAQDELILSVSWRNVIGPQVFSKVGTRNAMVIAVANLGLVLDEEQRAVRVALGSAGPTVIRAIRAERFIEAEIEACGVWQDPQSHLPKDAVAEFASLVAGAAEPIDDQRGTANYRRHALKVLAERSLTRCLREREGTPDVGGSR